MKWKNKGHEYDQFAELWSTREEYSLWGAAYTGRKFCSRFKSRLKIHEFYDSNPAKIGTVFEGYPVNAFAENTTSPRRKIIVTSGAYWEIRLKLLAAGLVENVDFCDSKLFTAVFQMYHLGELCLSRVDLVITNKCTLRCRDCNMSIPSFSDPQHVDINLLKQDLDAYFSYVDYLDKLDCFMAQYKSCFDVGSSKNRKADSGYTRARGQYHKMKKSFAPKWETATPEEKAEMDYQLRKAKNEMFAHPYYANCNNSYKCLHYCRYADDFIKEGRGTNQGRC